MHALLVEGITFRWRLLVGPRSSDTELLLWDEAEQQWDVLTDDLLERQRRCLHVRAFTATAPNGDRQVNGMVRIRDGSVHLVGDDLDLSAWHHVGGCLPCIQDDHGLTGDERAVFEELLHLWLGWHRAEREWRGLVEVCAAAAKRFARHQSRGALAGS